MNREKRMVTMFSSADGALTARKQDRNSPCACGSGKKAKSCCGCETKYFKSNKKKEAIKYPEDERVDLTKMVDDIKNKS